MISKDLSLSDRDDKSELEKIVMAGLHGTPQIRPDEKRKYLGVFREQVLAVLSEGQVKEPAVYPEINRVLNDPRSSLLIINGRIGETFTKKYQLLASAAKKPVKVVSGNEVSGVFGLVVAGSEAVNRDQVEIEPRRNRLNKLGVREDIIHAAGKKICKKCMNELRSKAPDELINYQELSLLDRIMGDDCPAHQ